MKINGKRRILFFVSLIGIVVVSMMMATTYAYQTIVVTKENGSDSDVTVNVANLEVSFTTSETINLTNMPLLKDYKSADYAEFTIDATNSTDDVAYSISLVDLTYSPELVTSDFKYNVTLLDNNNNETLLKSGDFSQLSSNSFVIQFSSGMFRDLIKSNSMKEKLRLYLWLKETNEEQNSLENSSFTGKIEISSVFSKEATDNTLAGSIYRNSRNVNNGTQFVFTPPSIVGTEVSMSNWDNASDIYVSIYDYTNDGTYHSDWGFSKKQNADFWGCMVGEYNSDTGQVEYNCVDGVTETYNTCEEVIGMYTYCPYFGSVHKVEKCIAGEPAIKVTNKYEKVLSVTQDDYGDSYYFRGNVVDNYMNYSGMCWRIVRTLGDGSVKLVLADGTSECDSSSYSVTNSNTAFWDNASYSDADIDGDGDIDVNYDLGYIPYTVYVWSVSNTKVLDTTYLSNTIWCNDISIQSKTTSNGYRTILYGFNNRYDNPSLKCDFTGINNTKANAISSTMGILSADETIFAGYSTFDESTNYLGVNAEGNYWTMTPYSLIEAASSYPEINIISNKYLTSMHANNFETYIRPSITLKPGITVTGTGIASDPYEIG